MLVNKQKGMVRGLIFLSTQKSSDVGYSHLVLENIDLICFIPRSWAVIRYHTQCRLSLLYLFHSCQYLIFFFFFPSKMRTTSAQSLVFTFILYKLPKLHVVQQQLTLCVQAILAWSQPPQAGPPHVPLQQLSLPPLPPH